MTFAQLQLKSAYSLLESTIRIEQLVIQAKQNGYHAVALTDHNVVYGLVDFYKIAKQQGIKPILGLTLSTQGLIKTTNMYDLVLLAKNEVGYRNILKLATLAQYRQSDLTFEAIVPYLNNLFVITPVTQSEIGQFLIQDDLVNVQKYFEQLQTMTDAESFYIGVSAQKAHQLQLTQLNTVAASLAMPLVALDEVKYLDNADAFSLEVLQHIKAQDKLKTIPKQLPVGNYGLKPVQTIITAFENLDLQQALINTTKIAEQCQVDLVFKRAELPEFKTPDNQSSNAYLQQQALTGLKRRFKGVLKTEYEERLAYELRVIREMGFADYFLIVADVLNYARQQNIMTSPGRGSAAGALVSYALGITEVDPIKYDLLFERFLNPERANMPDIDIDIPNDKRESLLKYVHSKYGAEHMAQIITFGTLAAKAALQDVGRVFGLTQGQLKQWSNAVPDTLKITLKQAYEASLPLRNLVADSSENRLIFETALKIEGLPRNFSTHAAGVVLSQKPLIETIALQPGNNQLGLTQFAMGNVEQLGLLKIDFLGLKNLGILSQIIETIKDTTNQVVIPKDIPLDDNQTLTLFQKGQTDGIFQFESDGIRNVLRRLKPTSFEDIVATDALYRPGPMENIETFIKRKHQNETITYQTPALQKILSPTYGILVYQEQVMQVASVMGGFTLGEADILRRAMSKKKKAVIDQSRFKFIQGAKEKGYDEKTATQVYDYIERFANYGFNRSHAVAYSMVAYWLAYFKVHYPAAFFTTLLNETSRTDVKFKRYLAEAKQQQLKICLPDINRSFAKFTNQPDGLLFGFESIKGLRRDFIQEIVKKRQNEGVYQSFKQFLQRIDERYLKVELLEALVYSGCFDRLDDNRKSLIDNMAELIENIKLTGNSLNLFEELKPKQKTIQPMPLLERLDKEAQYLGVYLSGHPISQYQAFSKAQIMPIANLVINQKVTIFGLVRKIKVIRTKTGNEMAFVTLQDESDEVSVTIFNHLYLQVKEMIQLDKPLLITGKTQDRQGVQVVADQISLGEPKNATSSAKLFLRIEKPLDAKQATALYTLLQSDPGNIPVVLVQQVPKRNILLNATYQVKGTKQLMNSLSLLLGTDNVVLQGIN